MIDWVRPFSWQDHKNALSWLWLLYRRPSSFEQAFSALERNRVFTMGLLLYFHGLPYPLVLAAVLHSAAFIMFDHPIEASKLLAGFAASFIGGLCIVVGGWAFGKVLKGVAGGLAFALSAAIAFGVTNSLVTGIVSGVSIGITVGILLGTPIRTRRALVLGIAGGGGLGIGLGLGAGIASGILLIITLLRAYYLLAHPIFVWPAARGSLYRCHPVAWDDLCGVPFPGLDRLLVASAQSDKKADAVEIDRLLMNPSQRRQALNAQVTLLAIRARGIQDLACLVDVLSYMPQAHEVWQKDWTQLVEGISGIAFLQAKLNGAQRPMIRELLSESLLKEIEVFRHRTAKLTEPLASQFRAAAMEWEKIAERQVAESRRFLKGGGILQVFRAGDPVNRESEAYVVRESVISRLDQQISAPTGSSGIVLYGRRRMGKSTLLNNLDGTLPLSVETRFVSMQDPMAFSSLRHFVEKISLESASDLPTLSRYLAKENSRLKLEGGRLILALDEYENIDAKIGEGVFPKDLLASIRDWIQQYRNIVWMFAGSHEISELTHVEWTSYLVSAKTIEIPPFTLDETRMLLTDPLKHSPLYQGASTRPIFSPSLWGPGGIERIHAEADGWPHLVQLIAEILAAVPNNEDSPAVSPEVMENALDEAVVSGQNVLYQLLRGECSIAGEWEYLSAFRQVESQPMPGDWAIRQSLMRRRLVIEKDRCWSLRVPLMARWLRARG